MLYFQVYNSRNRYMIYIIKRDAGITADEISMGKSLFRFNQKVSRAISIGDLLMFLLVILNSYFQYFSDAERQVSVLQVFQCRK